ncbi:MAG: hypothetical protein KDK40_02320, partial [Chlamydiia bacterium]|nr:hypothetical protein [Chlamydiia bacterium]
FVFITPSIVSEPCEDFERIRREQLDRRPGDIPEFLCLLEEARCRERHRCYAQGMRMLLGRTPERCIKWGDDICRYPHPNRIDTRHNHNQSWRGCHGR